MIHQYQLNGYSIVLDVYSGSVHVVDEVAYEMIRLYEKTEKEQIIAQMQQKYGAQVSEQDLRQCYEDLEALKAAGKLFSEDVYAEKALDLKKRSTVIKALCLHVAHTCNLNCQYCFASQGKYQGERA